MVLGVRDRRAHACAGHTRPARPRSVTKGRPGHRSEPLGHSGAIRAESGCMTETAADREAVRLMARGAGLDIGMYARDRLA